MTTVPITPYKHSSLSTPIDPTEIESMIRTPQGYSDYHWSFYVMSSSAVTSSIITIAYVTLRQYIFALLAGSAIIPCALGAYFIRQLGINKVFNGYSRTLGTTVEKIQRHLLSINQMRMSLEQANQAIREHDTLKAQLTYHQNLYYMGHYSNEQLLEKTKSQNDKIDELTTENCNLLEENHKLKQRVLELSRSRSSSFDAHVAQMMPISLSRRASTTRSSSYDPYTPQAIPGPLSLSRRTSTSSTMTNLDEHFNHMREHEQSDIKLLRETCQQLEQVHYCLPNLLKALEDQQDKSSSSAAQKDDPIENRTPS